MEPKIKTASDAVARFVHAIRKDDDIFLMTFDGKLALRQNFTSDRDKLTSALKKVTLGPGTLLYDTVVQGIEKIKDGEHDKKALLLITDGQDAGSKTRFNEALRRVRESSVVLYALGISAEGPRKTSGTHGDPPPS